MRKNLSLLSVLMLICALAFGQSRTVTGQVKNEKGDAVPFATITEAGTRNGVQADANGFFTIKIPQNAQLTITAAGHVSQTIKPGNEAQLITLTVASSQLAEVVVTTGFGVKRQAKEVGYSTATDKVREMGFGAGMGLPNMEKCADKFEVESVVGIGTTITMHMYI